jgi:hypothetical protein
MLGRNLSNIIRATPIIELSVGHARKIGRPTLAGAAEAAIPPASVPARRPPVRMPIRAAP